MCQPGSHFGLHFGYDMSANFPMLQQPARFCSAGCCSRAFCPVAPMAWPRPYLGERVGNRTSKYDTGPETRGSDPMACTLLYGSTTTPRYFENYLAQLLSSDLFCVSVPLSPTFLSCLVFCQDVLLSGLLNRDLNPAFNHIRGLKDIVECK